MWAHGTSTPYRPETNGIAERAVRRVKEGTSAALLQSGPPSNWWADAMQAFCFLHCIHDKLVDNRAPWGRRFGFQFSGPSYPFGCQIKFKPASPKDKHQLRPFGTQMLDGVFIGYHQQTGGGLVR